MKNFEFYNPVKIIFGKGKIAEISNNIPQKSRVLITYGGGSIKNNGILKQVREALKTYTYFEFGGIEPNPAYETLIKAVNIVKENDIDFLLAVGGGSVIDGTKFISAAVFFEGDCAYDICSKAYPVFNAIPIGTVLTLPATGSEMNANSVITRQETKEKFAFYSPLVMPKFSILDPETTYSLPKHQIANGVIDAYIHVIEQYITYPTNSPIQDSFAEGILKTLLNEGKKAYENDQPNYETRANYMWAATMALNGILSCGVVTDWATHKIGHELTALHGLDHAVTLAIVLPGILNEIKDLRREKLLQYAKNVLNIQADGDVAIDEAIYRTENFFNSLGVKTHLRDYSISIQTIDTIEDRFISRQVKFIGFAGDITSNSVRRILLSRL